MAKENSFDIVSTVDISEVDNAYQQASKELSQRYDLKDTNSTIDLNKQDLSVTITAPSDFTLSQIKDILFSKLIKRGIEINAINWDNARNSSGGNVTQTGHFINGLDKDMASKINKEIKAQKFKVKTQIEGDKLRVVSASRDTLQEVIAFVKEQDFDIPLQFTNYR